MHTAEIREYLKSMYTYVRSKIVPANDTQVGGDHYAKFGALQHWDFVAHFNLDYFQGQITKYVIRWKDKGGISDLKKAYHFLAKYIELQEAAAKTLDPIG
jgi:hypothetical protein